MIDCETTLYNELATALEAVYTDISVYGEYVKAPSSFPSVSIVELDNYVYEQSQDEKVENHAVLTYEVNVYSNLKSNKKAQCKAIFALIDQVFAQNNFTRTMLNPVQNAEDATIYRMTGRYRAVVSAAGLIYRR